LVEGEFGEGRREGVVVVCFLGGGEGRVWGERGGLERWVEADQGGSGEGVWGWKSRGGRRVGELGW
jgi:hypothetical protein